MKEKKFVELSPKSSLSGAITTVKSFMEEAETKGRGPLTSIRDTQQTYLAGGGKS